MSLMNPCECIKSLCPNRVHTLLSIIPFDDTPILLPLLHLVVLASRVDSNQPCLVYIANDGPIYANTIHHIIPPLFTPVLSPLYTTTQANIIWCHK